MAEVKIFSGTNSAYLACKVADFYGKELGKMSIRRFADSEISVAMTNLLEGATFSWYKALFQMQII
jgi:ribose-phosphate pyrophosphokinase